MKVWAVKVTGRRRRERVEADYYKVEGSGVLAFRHWRSDSQYPLTVRTFAQGYWLDIELKEKPDANARDQR